jgi:hypothetical protein
MKKPTMGRPPKPPGEVLTAKVNFLCLPEERVAMEQAAARKGIKLSRWVRAVAVKASH